MTDEDKRAWLTRLIDSVNLLFIDLDSDVLDILGLDSDFLLGNFLSVVLLLLLLFAWVLLTGFLLLLLLLLFG